MGTDRPTASRAGAVRRRAWLPAASLLVGSTVLAVVGAEAAVRLILPVGMAEIAWGTVRLSDNPTLMYELQPGVSDHNRFAFRGREPSRAKPEGAFRVAMLGDSITYGHGLAGPETIPSQLEAMLDHSSTPAEVLNFGVPGYSIIQEAEQVRVSVLGFEPDLAILLVCLNDWDAVTLEFQALLATRDSRMRFLSLFDRPDASRVTRWLYRSHLVRLTEYQIRRHVNGLGPGWGRYQLGPDNELPAIQSSVLRRYTDSSFYPAHFERLSRVLATQGIPLLVMLAPWNVEGGDEHYAERLAELTALCTGSLCTLVDFLAKVRNDRGIRFESEEVYGADQVHFTPTGATAVARFLLPHAERFR